MIGASSSRNVATMTRLRLHRHAGEILRTTLTVAVVSAVLLLGFSSLPPADPIEVATGRVALGLGADLLIAVALLIAIINWQTKRIARTHRALPALIEALALVFVVYIGLFARMYHVISTWNTGAFSAPLDYFTSVYFAMTVLSTVGFGDIVPHNNIARSLAMIQMVGNFVLLGLVVRVLTQAASSRRSTGGEDAS